MRFSKNRIFSNNFTLFLCLVLHALYINFFLFTSSVLFVNIGKKIIFSDNIPGIDIVFLCQKLQKRNRGLLNNSENMPNDKVLYSDLIFFFLKKLSYIKICNLIL